MYTIQQIKGNKCSAVFINNKEEYDVLKELGFSLCSYYGAYYYGVNEGMYNSINRKGPDAYSKGYTHIEYSDIDFEETPKIQQYELY